MKIAYLIAAHDNFIHLQRLVGALDDGICTFYIHIDKKSDVPDLKATNVVLLENRINVHWSGFSQVRSTLVMLDRAVKDDHDYFIFISGADYPVQPLSSLYDRLVDGGEYINITKGCDEYNPLSRYKYYYFTDFYDRRNKNSRRTLFFLWLQRQMRMLKISKKIPFQLYTGACWFALSKGCVQYILKEVSENDLYYRFFKTAFCPDECFFQTIIGNSPFLSKTKPNLTYADWRVNPGPANIGEEHVTLLAEIFKTSLDAAPFFARKFHDGSAAIVNKIETELKSNVLTAR